MLAQLHALVMPLPTVAAVRSRNGRCLLYPALAAVALLGTFAMTGYGNGLWKTEHAALLAFMLLCLAGRDAWRQLAANPFCRVFAAFALYGFAHAAYIAHAVPGFTFSQQLSANAEIMRIGVAAVAVGWWLSRRPALIPWMLILMLSGMTAYVLIELPWAQWASLIDGTLRLDIGYPTNLAGAHTAVAALLAAIFACHGGWPAHVAIPWRLTIRAFCISCFVVLCTGLFFTQSRNAWFATAALLPTALFALIRSEPRRKGERAWALPGLIAILALGLLAAVWPSVEKRLEGGTEFAQVLARTIDIEREAPPAASGIAALPPSSMGLRIHLYAIGWEHWQQRPWLGWGLRSIPEIIKQAQDAPPELHLHSHLHSIYVEAMVGLGSIGTGLLALALVVLIRALMQAWRAGRVPDAWFIGLTSTLAAVLIVNATDTLLWQFGFARTPAAVLLGCALAYSLQAGGPAHTQASQTPPGR